jgi:hypothetical protein
MGDDVEEDEDLASAEAIAFGQALKIVPEPTPRVEEGVEYSP